MEASIFPSNISVSVDPADDLPFCITIDEEDDEGRTRSSVRIYGGRRLIEQTMKELREAFANYVSGRAK